MDYRKCDICKARIYFTSSGRDPWKDIKAHAAWHDEQALIWQFTRPIEMAE